MTYDNYKQATPDNYELETEEEFEVKEIRYDGVEYFFEDLIFNDFRLINELVDIFEEKELSKEEMFETVKKYCSLFEESLIKPENKKKYTFFEKIGYSISLENGCLVPF